jgi:hypothetical protein
VVVLVGEAPAPRFNRCRARRHRTRGLCPEGVAGSTRSAWSIAGQTQKMK